MNRRVPSRNITRLLLALFLSVLVWGGHSFAVRIKDVTHVDGVRENQLIGYSLVVGLNGSGDGSSTEFTVRSLVAYLRRSGVTIDPELVKVANTAAVIVTADLPPFARPGMRLDVTVSSIGDAKSLQGGTLLLTPLKGADGQVYAVAQGSLSIGGFEAGAAGSSVTKNHPTAGGVPGGALVEKKSPTHLDGRSTLSLVLDNPDFTTARRIAEVINENFNSGCAHASDSTGVSIKVPAKYLNDLTEFLADVERLPIHPDQRARVVINERTGDVVMGEDVRISTLALAHGNLSIKITSENLVSQPEPFSHGRTTMQTNARATATEEKDKNGDAPKLNLVSEGVSLGEIVQSLNAIGVSPRDLISILQAIKTAGALQAELVIR